MAFEKQKSLLNLPTLGHAHTCAQLEGTPTISDDSMTHRRLSAAATCSAQASAPDVTTQLQAYQTVRNADSRYPPLRMLVRCSVSHSRKRPTAVTTAAR